MTPLLSSFSLGRYNSADKTIDMFSGAIYDARKGSGI
jgi:hypothetical protein